MEDLTGKQLGPYQIVAPLGEGGMAAVYKAYQPRMDRYVALKILPRYYASDPEFVARFKLEARVIAKLEHPHILPVHDFGEEEGYTFMAMRMVDSGTLTEWILANQPLSMAQIRRIISQVGDALDYAHSQKVIHRDIKPSNILVDNRGNCLLTDFGLAKLVETSVKLTRTGGILGTPAYMSPEQGMGQGIDHRTDQYSLGVILYEMATGRPPYQAETPMAIVIKHIQAPLPPPYKYNPDIPEALERVLLKSLAKDPLDRYATTGDFVTALQSATEPATIAGVTAPNLQAQTPMEDEIVQMPSDIRPAEPMLAAAVVEDAPTVAAARDVPLAAPLASQTAIGETQTAVSPIKSNRNKIIAGVGGFLLLILLAVVLINVLDEDDGFDEDETAVLENVPSLRDQPADGPPENEPPSPPDERQPISADAQTQEFIDNAEEAYERNDYQEAIRFYSDAINNEPAIADIHCQRGYVHLELGMPERASQDFDQCIRLATEQRLVELQGEAIAMHAMSESDMAADADAPIENIFLPFDVAIENPDAPDWLPCEYGERLFEYGYYDEAYDQFDVCQQIVNNEYWQARSQTVITIIEGDWAFEDEDYETAVELYSELTYLEPDAAYPHCLMGYSYLELSDYQLALDSFSRCNNKAGNEDPDARQWALEGETAVQIQQALDDDDLQEAIRGYNRIIEQSPDNIQYLCDRGELHLELGNRRDARNDFQGCFDQSWDYPELHDQAEELLQELGTN